MKLNKNKKEIHATRIFTDRTEPKAAFWNKYNYIKENLKNLDDVYVLNYYGVGGIGKSSLLRELIKQLSENEKKPYFLLYDFQVNQDIYAVLKNMRTNLIEKYKFDFPKFDIALLCYAKKLGDKANKKEIQSLVEQSRTLSLILDTTELIPQLSIASSILKLADSGIAWIRNLWNKDYNLEVAKLENQTAEDILKKFPKYFAEDMAKNIENLDKPFVMFLDTYEKLVDTIGEEGKEVTKDLWIRDDDGLILNIPGVLWVITGREKLRWEKYNEEWDSSIESHILGDLDFTDAEGFLKEAGFSDEKLIQELYDLTNGTPIYLDICVSTLEKLLRNEEEITIDKFGGNTDELLERFIRYMDVQTREMTHLLCLLEVWDDDLISKVASKILPAFSAITYETLKEASFIINDGDRYYVHKTVQEIINKECPSLIRNNYYKVMYDFLYTYLSEEYDALNPNSINYLNKYIEIFNETINDENANKYIYDFYKACNGVYANGNLEVALNCSKKEYYILEKKYSQTKNFYLIKNMYVETIPDLNTRLNLQHELLEHIMNNNIVDIVSIRELIKGTITRKDKLELIKYIEKMDLSKDINRTKSGRIYGRHEMVYKFIALNRLYYELGNIYKSFSLLKETLENDIDDEEKITVLTAFLFYIPNGEMYLKHYDQYEKYRKICEDILQKNENCEDILKADIFRLQYEMATILEDCLGDLEGAKYWIDKAEESLEKYGDNFKSSYIKITNAKTNLLSKIDKKEAEIYSKKIYEYIIDHFDENNIDVRSALFSLKIRYDYDGVINEIFELLKKYDKKDDINNIIYVWQGFSTLEELRFYLDKYILRYKDAEITEKNIKQIEMLLFNKKNKVYHLESEIETRNIYEKLYQYYCKAYDKNSEEVLYLLLKLHNGRIYDKDKKLEIAKEMIDIGKNIYGEDTYNLVEFYEKLSNDYCVMEKYEDGIKNSQKALELCNKYTPDDIEKRIEIEDTILDILSWIDINEYTKKEKEILEKYKDYYQENQCAYYIRMLKSANVRAGIAIEDSINKALEVYEFLKNILPENHSKMIEVLNCLDIYYYNIREYENSIIYGQKICDIYEKQDKNGFKHLESLFELSKTYGAMKKYDKELETLLEIYPRYKEKYGISDIDTVKVGLRLEDCYYELNEHQNALNTLLELIKNFQLNDNNEKQYEKLMSDIAIEYDILDDIDNSIIYYEKSVDFLQKKYGEYDAKTCKEKIKLASVYYEKEKYEETIKVLEELYSYKNKLSDLDIAKIEICLARGYSKISEEEKAMSLVEKGYDVLQEKYENHHKAEYSKLLKFVLETLITYKQKDKATPVAQELKILAEELDKEKILYHSIEKILREFDEM